MIWTTEPFSPANHSGKMSFEIVGWVERSILRSWGVLTDSTNQVVEKQAGASISKGRNGRNGQTYRVGDLQLLPR